jgi:hypothetical protein
MPVEVVVSEWTNGSPSAVEKLPAAVRFFDLVLEVVILPETRSAIGVIKLLRA